MIGDPDVNSGGCRVQAYMIVYFELVSLFWTVSIARVLQVGRFFVLFAFSSVGILSQPILKPVPHRPSRPASS